MVSCTFNAVNNENCFWQVEESYPKVLWMKPRISTARCCFSLLVVTFIAAGFHVRLIIKNGGHTTTVKDVRTPYKGQLPVILPSQPNPEKNFIYLVQTEACLPAQLQSFDQLGNGTELDVIVLSWKTKCAETREHITYYYDNKTTWSSGRNQLYHLALVRRQRYLYYIFLDDDLDLSFTADVPRDVFSRDVGNESPLRAFENFLRIYEPAIGLTNFCSRCGKMLSNGSYVAHLCCSTRTASGTLPPILPATISFDAAFNAFHTSVAPHLLPYRLKYEQESWWESQKYIILAADVLFRGQILRFNGVTAINKNHGKYPQQQLGNWRAILGHIRDDVPLNYRNQSLFLLEPLPDMVPDVKAGVIYTERWNITIPAPKAPIVPYNHFILNKYD